MPNPLVSVIVPTCNRPSELRVCLKALASQLPADGSVEIRVCDDGVGQETATLLAREFPSIIWHAGPRRGPAANRNLGASVARGNWLIFVDDDCIPGTAFVSSYLDYIKNDPQLAIRLAGATHRSGEPSLLWEAPHYVKDVGLPPSCNFALRRDLFMQFCGFDERYRTAFEDIEFFARLEAGGVLSHFLDSASVEHPARRIPSAIKLAERWEPRVIYTFDLGASPTQVFLGLSEHIFKIIVSRLLEARFYAGNVKASAVFTAEFIHAVRLLPHWIRKHGRSPRSAFWKARAAEGNVPLRFGL